MYKQNDYTEKKSAAQAKLDAYIEKVNADKPQANEITGAKEALDKAVADYNTLVVSDAYERLFLLTADDAEVGSLPDPAAHLKATDPLGRAFRGYRFSGLMKASIKRDKQTDRVDTGKTSLVCVADDDADEKKQVYHLRDIAAKWDELQTAAGVTQKAELMASPMWGSLVQKVRRLFIARSLSLGGYAIPSGVTNDYIVYTADGQAVAVADLTAEQKKALDDKVTVKALKAELQALVDAVYFDATGRKNGSNKYRVNEKDVHWLVDNAHRFDERSHKTVMMSDAKAYELAFCMVAHIVTGESYSALLGE